MRLFTGQLRQKNFAGDFQVHGEMREAMKFDFTMLPLSTDVYFDSLNP